MEIIFKNISFVSQTETWKHSCDSWLIFETVRFQSLTSLNFIFPWKYRIDDMCSFVGRHAFLKSPLSFKGGNIFSNCLILLVHVYSNFSTGWSLFPRWFALQPPLAMLDAWWFYSPSASRVFSSGYFNSLTACLQQVSASNVGRVCTEPAKPARPWETCIIQTASPAAPVVSKSANLVK